MFHSSASMKSAVAAKPVVVAGRRFARKSTCVRISHRCGATAVQHDFNAQAFNKELVDFAGSSEYIVKGGRDKFSNLPQAFKDIKEVRSSAACVCAGMWAERACRMHFEPGRACRHATA